MKTPEAYYFYWFVDKGDCIMDLAEILEEQENAYEIVRRENKVIISLKNL